MPASTGSSAGRLKIAFNASCLEGDRPGGWARYARELLTQFEKFHAADVKIIQYANRSGENHTLWEQRTLPLLCARDGVDVLHAPANGGLPLAGSCAKVLTVHDLFSEEDFRWSRHLTGWNELKAGLRYKIDWRLSLRAADRIIAVSDFTRGSLPAHLRAKTVRIYEGVTALPEDETDHRPHTREYLLYVGSCDARKRVEQLVREFQHGSGNDVDLVLIGRGTKAIAEKLASPRLHGLDSVTDMELARYYRHARAFITCARAEGFGLPLVEAMSVGKAVLYDGGGAIPEVCGAAGLRFGSGELGALLRKFEDEQFRMELAVAARARARCFDWRRAADETIACYREAARASFSSAVKSSTTRS